LSLVLVARRYAEALADVTTAANEVDAVSADLAAFSGLLKASTELRHLLGSPVVAAGDKIKVLDAIIVRTHPHPTTANLLRLLLGHARLHHVDLVYQQFQRVLAERRGIISAHVTAAAPVGDEEQRLLKAQLERMTGKTVSLEVKVDPAIIGGAVAKIGSVVFDGSIRARLNAVRQRLAFGIAP
jgi:F-type H+-transporting ATPase subunit delta